MIKKDINGIQVNYIPVKKFKHVIIGFCFQSKIDPDTYNERHMLPSLLEQHNRVYKDSESYNTHLDMLYGARFSTSVFQRGQMLSSQFLIRTINQKYIQDDRQLMDAAFEFLHHIIYQPKMYRSMITKKAVEDKLEETRDIIDTIHQDKASLAYYNFLKRVTSESHPSNFPIESKLDSINQETLTKVYHQLIHEDELRIYVIGDFDSERIDQIIKEKLVSNQPTIQDMNYRVFLKDEEALGQIEEFSDVSISRIYMAYKIHVDLDPLQEVYMELFNIIVGGHAQSKLFRVIREELHLVYYIYSTYLTENELFLVHFECEDKDEDGAISHVKDILMNIQEGDISESELDLAKRLLINNYLTLMDHLKGQLRVHIISDLIDKVPFDMEEKIKLINSVTPKDLVNLSKRMTDHISYRFKQGGDDRD